MRSSRPLSVTLGPQQASLDAHLASGEYASASEVLRAGLRALDRENAAFNAFLKAKVEEALADPRPTVPIDEVFDRLERKQRERRLRAERGA